MAKIDTRLFIVEGPPCTGKSETAHFIADNISFAGRSISLFDENTLEHPADYTFHAFMNELQIGALMPDERRQLYDEGIKTGEGYIIPLTKISVSLFSKVLPYKIYDNLDWETERAVILGHWRAFAEKARLGGDVFVFVGSFLKTPVSETMMRFDFPLSETFAFVEEIYRLIAPLDPAVIYLGSTDIAARVDERSGGRRSVWLSSAMTYHAARCYGSRRGLDGFDGFITCLQAQQKAELEILDRLPMRKLILTDAFLDSDDALDSITAFASGKSLQREQRGMLCQ